MTEAEVAQIQPGMWVRQVRTEQFSGRPIVELPRCVGTVEAVWETANGHMMAQLTEALPWAGVSGDRAKVFYIYGDGSLEANGREAYNSKGERVVGWEVCEAPTAEVGSKVHFFLPGYGWARGSVQRTWQGEAPHRKALVYLDRAEQGKQTVSAVATEDPICAEVPCSVLLPYPSSGAKDYLAGM